MPHPSDEPLIYTSRGNVPIASLERYIEWTKTDEFVKFREVYKDPVDGEIVKDSTAVLQLKGEGLGAEQASFG